MKRITLFVSSLLIAMVFASCDKEVVSTKTVIDLDNEDRMATITLIGDADLDFTTFGDEKVPDGTKVLFSVDKSTLVNNANGELLLEFAFMDGKVIAEVPTTETGVNYTITPIEFDYNTNPNPKWGRDTLVRYGASTPPVDVMIGESIVVDISYGIIRATSPITMVTLSGSVMGELDESNVVLETLYETKTLEFYNSNRTWYKSVQVSNNGTYSVSVPAGQNILCDYDFVLGKKVFVATSNAYASLPYTYEGTQNFGVISVDSPLSTLNIGGGSLLVTNP